MQQQGESIFYVQQQLGPASIQLMIDTVWENGYRREMKARWIVWDGKSGSRTVAISIGADGLPSILSIQPVDGSQYFMELARGIEPPTGGLQISPEAIFPPHITSLKHTEDPDPPLG
ncbi:MAG: hypothetical protein KIT40_14830 [Nitrospira sp.]|nr:hypothetical protein [Nitrospira sp.]